MPTSGREVRSPSTFSNPEVPRDSEHLGLLIMQLLFPRVSARSLSGFLYCTFMGSTQRWGKTRYRSWKEVTSDRLYAVEQQKGETAGRDTRMSRTGEANILRV